MSADLAGDVAVVTGAARGLGAAIAAELGRRGAHVVLADLRVEEVAAQTERLRGLGVAADWAELDIADADSVSVAAELIGRRHGDISILVNNAGISGAGRLGEPDAAVTWRRILDVNVDGTYRVIEAFLEPLTRTRGRIVNLASVVGLRSSFGNAGYATSKGAITSLTQHLARELAPRGIRVNAVAPGYFDTDMGMKGVPAGDAWVDWHVPLKRFGEPHEIAGPVAFLVSPAASYVHGVTLPVDGGYLVI